MDLDFELSRLKVAIVNDQMYSLGGGDRFFESIFNIFPQADLYSLYIDKRKYSHITREIKSIIPYNPITKFFYKTPVFNWFFTRVVNVLAPFIYETVDFTAYDVVITLTAKSAKGVITGLDTCHISIINTPSRFDWDKDESIRDNKVGFGLGFMSNIISTFFRTWDFQTTQRADYILTISKYIASKIRKYYRRDADVIYPPIKSFWLDKDFKTPKAEELEDPILKEKYFLFQSRLYDSKRHDIAIRAAIKAKVKLVIIGEGPEFSRLKKIAGTEFQKSIIFKGFLPDNISKVYYQNAQAFVFPAREDYGFVTIEAMACGIPVIAYNVGGVTETTVKNKHGLFFESEEELATILSTFNNNDFDKKELIKQASKFTEEAYREQFIKWFTQKYAQFRNR